MSQADTTLEYLLAALPLQGSRPIHPNRGGYTATMREDDGADALLASLSQAHKASEERLHLGWGSFRNLDIIMARKSSFAILCDVSLRQFDVWSKVAGLLKIHPERRNFISQLPDVLPSTPRPRYFGANLSEWLASDLTRPQSWLASDAGYAHIRELFAADRVVHLCLDLRDTGLDAVNPFTELAKNLLQTASQTNLVPDTIYLTNLLYMLAKPQGFFGESHGTASKNAAMIDVRHNLLQLAPIFRYTVSAHRLRATSTAADPHWITERFKAEEFIRFLDTNKS